MRPGAKRRGDNSAKALKLTKPMERVLREVAFAHARYYAGGSRQGFVAIGDEQRTIDALEKRGLVFTGWVEMRLQWFLTTDGLAWALSDLHTRLVKQGVPLEENPL